MIDCLTQAVSGHSLVLAEMAVSMVLAISIIPSDALAGWSATESLWLVGPPAAVYAMRSLFDQAAYRRCDAVTFNIVNQTKAVFCAVAAWFLLGEGQTLEQCAALLCAVGAGALLVSPSSKSGSAATTSGGNVDTCVTEVFSPSGVRKDKEGAGNRSFSTRPSSSELVEQQCSKLAPKRRVSSISTSGTILAFPTALCSGVCLGSPGQRDLGKI